MFRQNPSLPLLAGICLLLPACSSDTYLDHISLCQALAEDLLGDPPGIAWTGSKKKVQGYEDLEVHVSFRLGDKDPKEANQATCYYAYNIHDENASTDIDPMSVYETAPSTMTLNNRPVENLALAKSTNNVMLKTGKKMVTNAKDSVMDAAQRIQAGGQ